MINTGHFSANQQARAIKRVRKFTPVTLAMTFVLGFLNKPQATAADLAGSAALADVDVSPQLQTELDLRSGALSVEIEPGQRPRRRQFEAAHRMDARLAADR